MRGPPRTARTGIHRFRNLSLYAGCLPSERLLDLLLPAPPGVPPQGGGKAAGRQEPHVFVVGSSGQASSEPDAGRRERSREKLKQMLADDKFTYEQADWDTNAAYIDRGLRREVARRLNGSKAAYLVSIEKLAAR